MIVTLTSGEAVKASPGAVRRAANQDPSLAGGKRTITNEAVAKIGISEPILVTDEGKTKTHYTTM